MKTETYLLILVVSIILKTWVVLNQNYFNKSHIAHIVLTKMYKVRDLPILSSDTIISKNAIAKATQN